MNKVFSVKEEKKQKGGETNYGCPSSCWEGKFCNNCIDWEES